MGSTAPVAGDRVADILGAACRVVLRDGAHGLRMARVASEAGVSKTLLHYYFQTRQELLRAAFAFATDRWDEAVSAQLAREPNGAKQVELYLLASIDSKEPYDLHRALWTEVWSSLRVDSDLRPLVLDAYRAWLDRLVSLIDVGRRDGSIQKSVNARAAGLGLAAVADGLDSLQYVGLVDLPRAQQLLRESMERELARG